MVLAIASPATQAAPSRSAEARSLGGDADLVRIYLRDIGRVPMLTHEQEITLGRQVQELMALEELREELTIRSGGSQPTEQQLADAARLSPGQLKKRLHLGRKAKERMICANLRLVVSVAKKYLHRNLEMLDLIQEGTLGLVRGVEKFDPSRGYKFSTYAYWWIRQGITRAIGEKSRTIRLPINVIEALNKLKRGRRELSQKLGRTPSLTELADFVELPEEEVKDLMSRSRLPASLDDKVGDGGDTDLIELLAADSESPEDAVRDSCMKQDIIELLERLPALECRVLKMRYGLAGTDLEGGGEQMTLTAIGRVMGISRDRVRTIERDGLNHLRASGHAVAEYLEA